MLTTELVIYPKGQSYGCPFFCLLAPVAQLGRPRADERSAMKKPAILLAALALAGCKQPVDLYCESNADCAEWDLEFCDVQGEFPASDGIANTCIDSPYDASVPDGGMGDTGDGDVAECEPSTQVCEGDKLTVCDDSGQVEKTEVCTVGCSDELSRCLRMEPSNGLGMYLELSASEPALTIPSGAIIDTTEGTITDAAGTPIPAATALVDAPEDGVEIRVFYASSVVIESVEAKGNPALAIIAAGPIDVMGSIDLSGAAGAAPGADPSCRPTTIVADDDPERLCVGNAGGSFGAYGGKGGGVNNPGTADDNTGASARAPVGTGDLMPLLGGCAGGSISYNESIGKPKNGASGGKAGGALQLSSATSVRVGVAGSSAAILANGRGGQSSGALLDFVRCGGGGGGSGGGILLEAPTVELPFNSVLLANGGGGSCAVDSGDSAGVSGDVAQGGSCSSLYGDGGSGGTAEQGATAGTTGVDPADDPDVQDAYAGGGGGGGSVGRIRINTGSGNFSSPALISPNPSVGTIAIE